MYYTGKQHQKKKGGERREKKRSRGKNIFEKYKP
jgi:hypothetical protein